MKKTIKLLMTFVFMFSIAFANVRADGVAELGLETRNGRVSSVLPEENDTIMAVLDKEFDFSKISFAIKNSTEPMAGKSIMKKIILTNYLDLDNDSIGENWFSVYCLDGLMKYPEYSYINYTANFDGDLLAELTEDNAEQMLSNLIVFRLANDKNFKDVFAKAKNYTKGYSVNFVETNKATLKSYVEDIVSGDETTVEIKYIRFISLNDEILDIPAKDFAKSNVTSYPVEFKEDKIVDFMLDRYETFSLDKKQYDHALWIIEHTYPTFTLDDALLSAGVSKETLMAEIKELYNASELPGGTLNDEEWNKVLENYVYSTIQYAIWKATGGQIDDGKYLGEELYGSKELDKLYKYLIRDRKEYENYSTRELTNNLTLEGENKLFSQTKDYYVYGPFRTGTTLLTFDGIQINVTASNPSAVSIVDEALNPITKITASSQNFYIKVLKNAKIANVKVNLKTENAKTLFPSTNRGRIYAPYFAINQNVGSGGILVDANIEKSIDVVFNPKTGVNDIAILFVISIFAFSVGYLVLSVKNKAIKF